MIMGNGAFLCKETARARRKEIYACSFVAVTLLIVYILPRFFKSIPAPLIALVVLTALAIFTNFELRTVGDLGTITQSLPSFFLPDVPFSLETFMIIFPFSLA